jgi:hypothetical protein
MKKVLVFVGIAVLMTSVAAADVNPKAARIVDQTGEIPTRANGTLGSLTMTATQIGPLQVQCDASVTTQGGDGAPVVVTYGGRTYSLNNQVWLYAQIYDSPWDGGCTWWATPGPDWCAADEEFFLNSPTPLGSFAVSFTATVPVAMNYQTFVLARAGLTWITTGYDWFNTSQYLVSSVVETIYIGSTVVPTPTPSLVQQNPVPTMNRYGVIAMVVLLLGVAVLVLSRRH